MDFAELYRSHFMTVYRLCLAHFKKSDLAMEVTQEAFVRSLEKIQDLRNEESFLAWVSSIAINYGRNKIKLDNMRYNELPPLELMEQGWDSFDPEELDIEDVNFIRRWILTLQESDQQLLLMKFYYNMSDKEISEQAERPVGSIKRRLYHLKQKLEQAMTQELYGEYLLPPQKDSRISHTQGLKGLL